VIKVYNNLGHTVFREKVEKAAKNIIQVSCASWQKGIYQIITMDENNILSRKKIIIQ
jgi:hypothetical protein